MPQSSSSAVFTQLAASLHCLHDTIKGKSVRMQKEHIVPVAFGSLGVVLNLKMLVSPILMYRDCVVSVSAGV